MKRVILFWIGMALLFSGSANAQNGPCIRFGVIADIQYADRDPSIGRHYRNSLPKLEECVDDLNRANVDFTIILGDLVDERPAVNLPAVLQILSSLDAPLYNTTGNHDYGDGLSDFELYEMLGMPASYYSFLFGKWLFVMLNSNETAGYNLGILGTEREQELSRMMSRLGEGKRKNAASYNGGLGNEQLSWLGGELDRAEKENLSVILLTHHPLCPENGFEALDNRDILDILDGYECVRAVFSGHHHAGNFAICNGLPSVTMEGMVETENDNAYGIVEIYGDKIVLKGRGRTPDRELLF